MYEDFGKKYLEYGDKKEWTYEDYYSQTQEGYIFECINGVAFKESSKPISHSRLKSEIIFNLFEYNKGDTNRYFVGSGMDVVLSDDTFISPDIFVVLKDNDNIIQDRAIFGSPDLIVEIVTEESTTRDYDIKKELYLQYSVKEYWIVDMLNRKVMIHYFSLDNNLFYSKIGKGVVESLILKDYKFRVEDVFSVLDI